MSHCSRVKSTSNDILSQHVADLTRRTPQLHKENKAPTAALSTQIQKTNQRSILNTTERRLAPVRRATPISTNVPPDTSNLTTAASNITPTLITSPNTTTTNDENHLEFQKRLSMVDVSGMLLEFYKTNVAKAPKTQQQQLQLKYRQTSPTSAETNEPSTIAAIATNGAAEAGKASKNLQGGEVPTHATGSGSGSSSSSGNINTDAISSNSMKSMAFHPRIKYTNKNLPAAANDFDGESVDRNVPSDEAQNIQAQPTMMTSIPTSVVVPTSPQIDVKPLINPATGMIIEPTACVASVIRPVPQANNKPLPTAAAIAAALLQQQLRAQELQRAKGAEGTVSSKILEKLLRQQRQPQSLEQCNPTNAHDDDNDNDETEDEEYEERYANFEDIHLTEDSKQSGYGVSTSMPNIFQASMNAAASAGHNTNEYFSQQSQKLLLAQAQAQVQAQAMRNLEYSFSDFSGNDSNSGNPNGNRMTTSPHNGSDASGEAVYECRHCGKKYRWKSTLRRHENVECGGKEPAHQCPYCPYKSKQRGNLGVHVRKHHSDLPQLASKRRSKYSQNVDNGNGEGGDRPSSVSFSANASDDSSSKLVIDFSK